MAIARRRAFECDKAWRYWSSLDPTVHYALYQFAGELAMDTALASQDIKGLIADFDRNFPTVARTRDKLVLAQERAR